MLAEDLCAGDTDWLAFGRAHLGIAKALRRVEAGKVIEGASDFRRALAILASTGLKVSSLHAVTYIDVCREAGWFDEAQQQLDPLLAIADNELVRIYAPKVYLAAARLCRSQGNREDAVIYSRKAHSAFDLIRAGEDPARRLFYDLTAFDDPMVGPFVPDSQDSEDPSAVGRGKGLTRRLEFAAVAMGSHAYARLPRSPR